MSKKMKAWTDRFFAPKPDLHQAFVRRADLDEVVQYLASKIGALQGQFDALSARLDNLEGGSTPVEDLPTCLTFVIKGEAEGDLHNIAGRYVTSVYGDIDREIAVEVRPVQTEDGWTGYCSAHLV